MHILFLFFDGIGLGLDDQGDNPFAVADLPTLTRFTDGNRWLNHLTRIETDRSVFVATDACLGVAGRPQSATGQAAILTGMNVPEMVGKHYGPKPTQAIRDIIHQHGIIKRLVADGKNVGFLNAYPSTFLEAIEAGKRLPSSNQEAMLDAGVALFDGADFIEGRAISVDFTGDLWRGYPADNDAATIVWRQKMNRQDTPVMTAFDAGVHLAKLAASYDLAFVDHWMTDYLGHRGTMDQACRLLTQVDGVMEGLLSAWDFANDIILLTSDHGNLEAISERGHTRNAVPTLVVGDKSKAFSENLTSLLDIAPAIVKAFDG